MTRSSKGLRSAVLDTSLLLAALSRRDPHHEAGKALLVAAEEGRHPPLLITEFILAETLNYLVRKAGSAVAREALKRLEMTPGLRLERTPDTVFAAAKGGPFQRIDGLSFVDALTVAFMEARGLRWIYSLDAGFDRAPNLARLERMP